MGVDCLWFSLEEIQIWVSLAWLGLISLDGVFSAAMIVDLKLAKLIVLVAEGNREKLTWSNYFIIKTNCFSLDI